MHRDIHDVLSRRAATLLPDALGAASTLPVPPMTDNINGADTNVVGTLEAINREWVVLKQNDIKKTWIPREVILLIEVEQQKSGA